MSSSTCDQRSAIVIRALVGKKHAQVILGKNSVNLMRLQEENGVTASLSEAIPGVGEQVLRVLGSVESATEAYFLIASDLIRTHPLRSTSVESDSAPTTFLRLLIPHNMLGSIIGRHGRKIKAMHASSGAQISTREHMLPNSTEHIMQLYGTSESIRRAVRDICLCFLEDDELCAGTVLFHSAAPDQPSSPVTQPTGTRPFTREIDVPSDMVGSIIGRGGTNINEMKRMSGAEIVIAKAPREGVERQTVTIVETYDAYKRARTLLYEHIEKTRRARHSRRK
ncbi:hypothetical protein BD311DRAFT_779278 [Dichomitus squalens]|uniref:K Homology domain-containing protein n=1 Tax=Dichomitus squalens TaxID=114155 RepID=A0A4Q9MHN1_9APHY|nr:hypothetical protein BD311DRAFT_779278 [Dichomitus squalens]